MDLFIAHIFMGVFISSGLWKSSADRANNSGNLPLYYYFYRFYTQSSKETPLLGVLYRRRSFISVSSGCRVRRSSRIISFCAIGATCLRKSGLGGLSRVMKN